MGGKVKFTLAAAFALLGLLVLPACQSRDYARLPATSAGGNLQAVIECPAGSNLTIFYCQSHRRFHVEMNEENEKKVDYLPFPVNHGFVPSTLFSREEGAEGKMVDILVICDRLETGTVLEVIPLGIMILKDEAETFYQVISIPANLSGQVITASSLTELNLKYPSITGIIGEWYTHSDKSRNLTLLGWEDEQVARQFVDKWIIR